MLTTKLFSISKLAAEAERYKTFLSTQEIEKSQRMLDQEKGLYYITCRGKLRELLSRVLDKEPEHIIFSYNKYGKPYLEGSSLFFNCSHSRDAFAVCLSDEFNIGVDIEFINLQRNIGRLTMKVFSPEETLLYNRYKSSEEKSMYFYKLWTIKEAITKEHGTGIIASLNTISPHSKTTKKNSQYVWNDLYIHHKNIDGYSLALASKDQRPNQEFFDLTFL